MTHIDLTSYNFSALIFDCDGTLAHTAPLHFQSMATAVAEQGYEMTRDWYYQRVGLSRIDLFEDFERTQNVPLDREAAAQKSKDVFRSIVHQAQPVTRVVATARHYSDKLPIAVASGAEGDLVQGTLLAIGANQLFPHVVTVTDIPVGKPAPDLFLEAARRLNISPQDCLVFEDSNEGLEAAKRASMNAIDVRLALAS